MITTNRLKYGARYLLAAGLVGALLGAALPVVAQTHGGGGGHAGGGGGGGAAAAGGHFGGGGGGGPGGHFGGGGGAAAGAHFGGGGASQFGGGPRISAGHFNGAPHVAAGGNFGRGAAYAGANAAGGAVRGYPAGPRGAALGGGAVFAHPGPGFNGRGYSSGAHWGGGYWRGGYWPRAYYGYGFTWFLPVLPLAYATYWYDGIPYYYSDDVYYTWNPDYNGYVATDPPPVAAPDSADGSAVPATDLGGSQDAEAQAADTGAQQADSGQVFMYPKNGQSAEQQSLDKQECQRWASDQVGLGSNGPDYRRALVACVEGRGYSAN